MENCPRRAVWDRRRAGAQAHAGAPSGLFLSSPPAAARPVLLPSVLVVTLQRGCPRARVGEAGEGDKVSRGDGTALVFILVHSSHLENAGRRMQAPARPLIWRISWYKRSQRC